MLSQYVSDSHFDLIAITETWLSDDDLSISSHLTFNKCKLIQHNRSKKGGGVALLWVSVIGHGYRIRTPPLSMELKY